MVFLGLDAAAAMPRFWNMVAYDEAYFWATHQGAEIDLVLFQRGRRVGIECKRVDAPALTPSMRIALADLKLDRLIVVYPGQRRYRLAPRVEVIPLMELVEDATSVFARQRR